MHLICNKSHILLQKTVFIHRNVSNSPDLLPLSNFAHFINNTGARCAHHLGNKTIVSTGTRSYTSSYNAQFSTDIEMVRKRLSSHWKLRNAVQTTKKSHFLITILCFHLQQVNELNNEINEVMSGSAADPLISGNLQMAHKKTTKQELDEIENELANTFGERLVLDDPVAAQPFKKLHNNLMMEEEGESSDERDANRAVTSHATTRRMPIPTLTSFVAEIIKKMMARVGIEGAIW